MRILVLVSAYPNLEGAKSLYYVHSRNLYYNKYKNIEITVLNFQTQQDYIIDGIEVISLLSYIKDKRNFELLICHAANIRNHYIFLKKYGTRFRKKIFFFHGHEILHIEKYYPKPYFYMKKNMARSILQNYYDNIKIFLWKNYFVKKIKTIRLIFVSNWLYERFISELDLEEYREEIKTNSQIISNSVGEYFEQNKYSPNGIEYDFITIRSNIDESTYCIDLLSELANKYPKYSFCLIGKGKYFNYYKKPKNLHFIEGVFHHNILAQYLNKSKCALFLTRHDTQGLMACEVATFGIPLITSDIEICREIFKGCQNVQLISNEKLDLDICIDKLSEKLKKGQCKKWNRYYAQNTIDQEIEYIKSYCIENNEEKYNDSPK